MKTPAPSYSPPNSSQTPPGNTLALSNDFGEWWSALSPEDRDSFILLGGDEGLARFVHSYDTRGGSVVEAYARSAGLDPSSNTAAMGASTVWKHDAVIDLLGCLRYRDRKQAAASVTRQTVTLIKDMLSGAADAATKDQAAAVKAALTFVKMVNEEDIKDRIERIRRGVKQGAAITGSFTIDDDGIPSEDSAVVQLRMLREQFPNFDELVDESRT